MSDRGMKKWVSFRALVEQASSLSKSYKEKRKIEKPLISNERAEEINDILFTYKGEELLITYYRDGFVYKINTTLIKIDELNRKLILPERKNIYFKEITNIEKI